MIPLGYKYADFLKKRLWETYGANHKKKIIIKKIKIILIKKIKIEIKIIKFKKKKS